MTVDRRRQVLPPAAAEELRRMRADAQAVPMTGRREVPPERREAWTRLTSYINALVEAGWTLQAVAPALGMSRQGAAEFLRRYPPESGVEGLPAVPAPPEKPVPVKPPSPWSPPLPADVLEELRALREASKEGRGPIRGTPREGSDPRWQASIAFATRVQALLDGEYTLYRIGHDLGIEPGAVARRLARHGFREFSPSARPKS